MQGLFGGPDQNQGPIMRPQAFADRRPPIGLFGAGPNANIYQSPADLLAKRDLLQGEDVTAGQPLTIGGGLISMAKGLNKRVATDQLDSRIANSRAMEVSGNQRLFDYNARGLLGGGPAASGGMPMSAPGLFHQATPPAPVPASQSDVQAGAQPGPTLAAAQQAQPATDQQQQQHSGFDTSLLRKDSEDKIAYARELMATGIPDNQKMALEIAQQAHAQMSPFGMLQAQRAAESAQLAVEEKRASVAKTMHDARQGQILAPGARLVDEQGNTLGADPMADINARIDALGGGGGQVSSAGAGQSAGGQPGQVGQPAPGYVHRAGAQDVPTPAAATGLPDLSPQTIQAIKLELAAKGGAADIQKIINSDPHRVTQDANARKMGENSADLVEKQRAGKAILQLLDQLGETASSATDDVLEKAIGPYNTTHYNSWLPGIGGKTVPELLSNSGSTFGRNDAASAPWNLQNEMNHDIEGLTTAFIAASGSIKMSDDRQAAFANTMGAMMRATSRPEYETIRRHARRIIQSTFGVPYDYQAQGQAAQGAPPSAAPTGPISPGVYNWTPDGGLAPQ